MCEHDKILQLQVWKPTGGFFNWNQVTISKKVLLFTIKKTKNRAHDPSHVLIHVLSIAHNIHD